MSSMAITGDQTRTKLSSTDEVSLSIRHSEDPLDAEDVDLHDNDAPNTMDRVRGLSAQIDMLREDHNDRLQTLTTNLEHLKDFTISLLPQHQNAIATNLQYYSQRQQSETSKLMNSLRRDLRSMQAIHDNLRSTMESNMVDLSSTVTHLNELYLELSDYHERLDRSVTDIHQAFIRSIPFVVTTFMLILYIFVGSRV